MPRLDYCEPQGAIDELIVCHSSNPCFHSCFYQILAAEDLKRITLNQYSKRAYIAILTIIENSLLTLKLQPLQKKFNSN